jgi:hypothetical protein
VIAEFNVWLLIVGLVVGAGLVWVVMMDGRRRESEIDAIELPREAAWFRLLVEDLPGQPEAAEQALLLHRLTWARRHCLSRRSMSGWRRRAGARRRRVAEWLPLPRHRCAAPDHRHGLLAPVSRP